MVMPRHLLAALLPLLDREAHAARLDLRRFDADGVRALVLGRYTLPKTVEARLIAWLVERAEGNAFFTAQLLRALEDEGALRRLPATPWRWATWKRVGLLAPLRQRPPGPAGGGARLLALAAVIGADVPLALGTVAETDEEGLLDTIERAVGRGEGCSPRRPTGWRCASPTPSSARRSTRGCWPRRGGGASTSAWGGGGPPRRRRPRRWPTTGARRMRRLARGWTGGERRGGHTPGSPQRSGWRRRC